MVGKLRFAALRCNLWIPAVALMFRPDANALTLMLGVVSGSFAALRCNELIPAVALMFRPDANVFTLLGVVSGRSSVGRMESP
jgi:hypothetical protein